MRFFRARSLILSPSKKSIARLALPSRPALKSLSGSGSRAPCAKVSFTLPLWALATAMIPSRDHTGLPIHFHSSMISASAARMVLRTISKVSRRQSGMPAISWSICSDGVMRLTTLLPVVLPNRQAAAAPPLRGGGEGIGTGAAGAAAEAVGALRTRRRGRAPVGTWPAQGAGEAADALVAAPQLGAEGRHLARSPLDRLDVRR